MRPQVLLAFPRSAWTTGVFLERALARVADVHHVDTRSLPDRDVIRARLPWGRSAKRAARAAKMRPDLYVQVDGDGRRHLRKPRALGCPTLFWAIDSHRPYKREFLRYVALDFDHVFVAQKEDVPAFRGPATRSHWLPLAADPDLHRDMGLTRDLDVGYVGSLQRERHPQRLAALATLQRTHRVEARHGLFGEEMARLYSRSRVVFNRSIGGDVNMRVFEAMSCGACLVTDRIGNGLEELFRDREHLLLYDDWTMLDTVDEALADDGLRERVARAGRAEVVARHTYAHRAATMLRTAGFEDAARDLERATGPSAEVR